MSSNESLAAVLSLDTNDFALGGKLVNVST